MTLVEMRQARGQAWEQAKAIHEKATAENRDFTSEETVAWDAANAEVDRLGKAIEREERSARIGADLDRSSDSRPPRPPAGDPDPQDDDPPSIWADRSTPVQRALEMRGQPEYALAFEAAVRFGENALPQEMRAMLRHPELRALEVGTTTEGGFLVPTEFEDQLNEIRREANVMRGLARTIRTAAPRDFPVMSTLPALTWTAEEAAFTESDPAFTNINLSAYKGGLITKVSEELMVDSAFDLNAFLQRTQGEAIAAGEEAAFVNGAGTTLPTGAVQGSGLGKTFASATAITGDELIDLFHSLKRVYRNRATWLMSDAVALLVRKLKTSDLQYIWQPGLAGGQPDRLLNRPVAISDDMPAPTLGLKSILFGDFATGYVIADRVGLSLQVLRELYAANGQVGFRSWIRVDGKVVVAEAIKHGIQA